MSPDTIIEKLSAIYGEFEQTPRYDALDELIFTVLTQHTSDLNAERAFVQLREKIPTWEEVMVADQQLIADAIFHGGMSNQKSKRIKDILATILERHGELEIEFLRNYELEDARKWLVELPGVGPKTAAVVMAFALGMPAFPVDTHIHRVSKRLGLIEEKTTADAAHEIMERQVRPELRFQLHMQMITHGRQICKARRPLCGECPLSADCPSSTV
ncbi:MAG: endonuclease III [Chloroflexi bacterium]|nr:endonuclease III [Chloroflexota bacterium]MYK62485.1 endonuclease III [Chloroflexota bacterium]